MTIFAKHIIFSSSESASAFYPTNYSQHLRITCLYINVLPNLWDILWTSCLFFNFCIVAYGEISWNPAVNRRSASAQARPSKIEVVQLRCSTAGTIITSKWSGLFVFLFTFLSPKQVVYSCHIVLFSLFGITVFEQNFTASNKKRVLVSKEIFVPWY